MSEEQSKPDMTPGIVSWNELMTSDAKASETFYGGLFGWTAEAMDMGDKTYTMFNNGGRPVAGMLEITREMGPMPPNWGMYVTVEKLEEAVAKAEELGGKVRVPVTELKMGRFAIISDPTGATLGLWEYAGGED